MFEDKNVDDDFFKAKNPPYYKPVKSLLLDSSYYQSYHKEALFLEHVEKVEKENKGKIDFFMPIQGKVFANYFEYLVPGKLLIIRESFLSFIY